MSMKYQFQSDFFLTQFAVFTFSLYPNFIIFDQYMLLSWLRIFISASYGTKLFTLSYACSLRYDYSSFNNFAPLFL